MGRTILAHSAPGSTWKDHKYSKRVKTPSGYGYIYTNGSHNTVSKRGRHDDLSDKGYNSSTGTKTKQETGSIYGQGGVINELTKQTGETTADVVNAVMQQAVGNNIDQYDSKKVEITRQDVMDAVQHANRSIKYQGNGIWRFDSVEGQPHYASEGPALERLIIMAVEEHMRFRGHNDSLPGFNDYIDRKGKTSTQAYRETMDSLQARKNSGEKIGAFANEHGQAIRRVGASHTGQLSNIYGRMKNTSSRKNTDKMLKSMDPNSADYNALKNMMNNSLAVRVKKKRKSDGSISHSAEGTTWKKKNPKYERRVGTPPNAYYIYRNGSHSTGPVKNLKTSGSDVSDAWEEAASTTGSYIKETGEEAAESIKNAVSTTGNYVKEKAVETKDQAQAYVNRKADETRTAINRHADAAKRNVDQLKTKSRAATEDAKRQIDAAANEANRQVTRVKNSAINTYVNTKANVARSYNSAKESATNTYNRAAGEVQAYGKRARESAINTRNNIQRSAKAAQRNFEEGINNTVNAARNAYNQGASNARASINSARNYLNVQKARLQNSYNSAANYAKSEYNRILKEAQRQIDAIEARARKIANASSNLASDIGGAGRKWKEEAFHDGMYNGAYIIHKVSSNPELVLCHSRAGTTWEKLNHKYIAKIDGKYFYTPEELRAFKSGASDKARGLADKGKEYWEKAKEKGSEYYEKGKEKFDDYMNSDGRVDRLAKESINNAYQNGRAKLTKKGQREERYVASKMADQVNARRYPYNENIGDRTRTSSGRSNMNKSTSGKSYKEAVTRDKAHQSHNKWHSDVDKIMKDQERERKYNDKIKYSVDDTMDSVRRKVHPGDKFGLNARNKIWSGESHLANHHLSVQGKYKHVEPNARDRGYGDSRGPKVTSGVSRGYSNGRTGGSKGTDKYLVKDNISRTASKYVNSAKAGASKSAEYAKEGYSKAKQGASKGYEYAKQGASKGAEYAREGYSKAKDWYDEQKRKREYRRGFRSGWNSVRGN